MTQTTRAISHRDGVPIYQYRTDPDTPPVSVHRHDHGGTPNLGRHIHDFPALWYVPAEGLVYVAAAGRGVRAGQRTGCRGRRVLRPHRAR